jgi:cytidine deaminase
MSPAEAGELVAAARAARRLAYAPYSNYQVGAALLTEDGAVVTAANVENASYGLSICAERVAATAAVAGGHRRFAAIAVVVGGTEPASPCGACRQVLYEFPPGPDLQVICAAEQGDQVEVTTLGALLPGAFGPARLGVPPP